MTLDRSHAIAFLVGVAVGLAAYWVWTKREMLGFVVDHQGQLSGLGQIYDGWKKVTA